MTNLSNNMLRAIAIVAFVTILWFCFEFLLVPWGASTWIFALFGGVSCMCWAWADNRLLDLREP